VAESHSPMPVQSDRRMAKPISADQQVTARPARARTASAIAAAGGAVLGAALLLTALVLWFRYGTTVFFETIVSGIAGCF
jgi:hypothetical protein